MTFLGRRQTRSPGPRGARQGVTVLEVLVVCGVLAILVALLAPAVQRSRESSRNASCKSHLRQMGMATHSFHDAHGRLPDHDGYNFDLLPHLDQGPIVQLIVQWKKREIGQLEFEKQIPRSFSLYLCPSDSWESRSETGFAPCQYLVNGGSTFPRHLDSGIRIRGQEYTRLRDITDGLSQTALLAERLAIYSPNSRGVERSRADPIRFQFWIDRDFFDAGQEGEFSDYCLDPSHLRFELEGRNAGDGGMEFWFMPWTPQRAYDHILPPNSIGCFRGSPFPHAGYEDAATPATSMHPGGVNLALCDGSVRFVSNSIDRRTWRALGTIARSDLIGDF